MRNAILQMPEQRSGGERRQVLRTAIRQLERAESYLGAVGSLDLDDRPAQSAAEELRLDVRHLIRYLSDQRARIEA